MTPRDPDAPRAPELDARDAWGVQVGTGGTQVNAFVNAAPPVAWPVIIGRAPLIADAYVERAAIFAELDPVADADGSTPTFVLHGDGGTGKTQLAAAVFHRALGRAAGGRSVDVAVWVTASSRSNVLAAYSALHASLRLPPAGGDVEAEAAAALNWLADTERPWLLVLDDVADPGDLVGLWPRGGAGRVVVTSRRRDASLVTQGRIAVDVDVFSPEESVEYLRRKLQPAPGARDDASAQAAELAGDLGHLPLALSQAAAVVLNDGITCADYRRAFADRSRRLAELFDPDVAESGDEYPRPLAATWSLATERADALEPRGRAGPMLALVAHLDPNGVPEEVLTSEAARKFVGGGSAVSAEDARRTIRNLHRLSLVRHDPGGGPRAVRMHALAQRATIDHLDAAEREVVKVVAADAIFGTWPEIERDRALVAALRANVAALDDRGASLRDGTFLHLVFRAGNSLGGAGMAQEAVAHFDVLATRCTDTFGELAESSLVARGTRAYWREKAGDAEGALEEMSALLPHIERELGPDDPNALSARESIAHYRRLAGDAGGALEAMTELRDHSARVAGVMSERTLMLERHIANAHGDLGDHAEAIARLEALLPKVRDVAGENSPQALVIRHDIAAWHSRSSDFVTAVAQFEELVSDYYTVLGPESPTTLGSHASLAFLRGYVDGPEVALADLADVLLRTESVLGPQHGEVARIRRFIERWQARAGRA
ncbi:MAG TPA: tetratricopeptide repeat protein [Mycobacteriales bacterium]|jgi:hypothetical protein